MGFAIYCTIESFYFNLHATNLFWGVFLLISKPRIISIFCGKEKIHFCQVHVLPKTYKTGYLIARDHIHDSFIKGQLQTADKYKTGIMPNTKDESVANTFDANAVPRKTPKITKLYQLN